MHRQLFVQINSNCSFFLTSKYVVPRGSVLGPIFNLYVTDMSSIAPNINSMQYPDASTLYRSWKLKQKDSSIKESLKMALLCKLVRQK